MKLFAALALALTVPLAACGGGSSDDDKNSDDSPSDDSPSDDTPSDDTPSDDTPSDDSPSDDSPSDDTPSDDSPSDDNPQPAECDVPESFAGGTLADQQASVGDQGEKEPLNRYFVGGLLNADTSPDALSVELWDNYGAFLGDKVKPGTYTIAGDELSLLKCGVCVAVVADVAGQTGKFYFATGGSVTIDQITPNLKGSVANVALTEWDLENDAPVADGCTTLVSAASFDATVEQEQPEGP